MPIPSLKKSVTIVELLMGVLMLHAALLSLTRSGTSVATPFLVLFATGYLYVGLTSAYTHLRAHLDVRHAPTRDAPPNDPAPEAQVL